MEFDAASARAFLQLPEGYALPDVDDLMHDARAILLHTVNLRTETRAPGIQISPVWENRDGQAALRATVVPVEIEARHFEGKGMMALRDPNALTMIADAVEILADEPVVAAQALVVTASVWISEEAPVRPLGLPYKGHFKLLTLVIADFLRKVGAGFDELEWLTSIGLLGAYHNPDEDPPAEQVRAAAREKSLRLAAEEEAWMAALLRNAEG
ncbi:MULTISPECIES: hypothetical protein [Polyangium]|uniref:Uncharacterized protein n=2 Tax=Polyangium TaxID=55 RepID=A0A4V5PND1_9BACT|nr:MULTISPECIES: hypothetical protein [Polyangium]MDI1428563.1 hypothetical protein [Polyangium sorediatum]TKD11856.1 hypothetical protein E8A74_06905 [Polyangium fumosum]